MNLIQRQKKQQVWNFAVRTLRSAPTRIVTFGDKGNEEIVKAQIWDTAGEERYRSVTKAYYKGAKGALLVYDITKRRSFENIDNWLIDLRTNGDKDILIMLIGNKSDLKDSREVSKDEAESKAEQYNIPFFETSAKNGENITNSFSHLVEEIYKTNLSARLDEIKVDTNNDGKGINIEEEVIPKKGCCQ